MKWRKTSGYASNPTNKMISIVIFDRNYEQRLILEWKTGKNIQKLKFWNNWWDFTLLTRPQPVASNGCAIESIQNFFVRSNRITIFIRQC